MAAASLPRSVSRAAARDATQVKVPAGGWEPRGTTGFQARRRSQGRRRTPAQLPNKNSPKKIRLRVAHGPNIGRMRPPTR